MNISSLCIALAGLLPLAATAAPIGAGQYSVAGIQQICLVGDGTWYGTTFAGWGGRWLQVTVGTKVHTHVFGNYASGAGNDSIALKGSKGSWTEWRDDQTFQTVINPMSLSFVKAVCDPPAAAPAGVGANPMQ